MYIHVYSISGQNQTFSETCCFHFITTRQVVQGPVTYLPLFRIRTELWPKNSQKSMVNPVPFLPTSSGSLKTQSIDHPLTWNWGCFTKWMLRYVEICWVYSGNFSGKDLNTTSMQLHLGKNGASGWPKDACRKISATKYGRFSFLPAQQTECRRAFGDQNVRAVRMSSSKPIRCQCTE